MSERIVLLFATRNAGKVAELVELTRGLPIEVRSLEGYDVPEVEEDGDTFESNAAKKAREVSAATGLPALADDSGLEVDALDGAPGVYSARYAGEDADDEANNEKLIEALLGVVEADRTARFRSTLALADVGGALGDDVILASGSCEGQILTERQGTGGFGYDPLFYSPELGQTFAEAGVGSKNQLSHRAQAMKLLLPELKHYFHL
ncbi:MAG: XTP/dITP diphosphatase [Myxococcales bacterium]|nr:XTP/dITP diphosphatase [Myxococcales bacterium]